MLTVCTTLFSSVVDTHDVQGIIVNTSSSTEAFLSVIFLRNSAAMGALLLFIPVNSDPIFSALDREKSEHYVPPFSADKSELLVYDIEDNGLLYRDKNKNYPAVTLEIHEIHKKGKTEIINYILYYSQLLF